MKNQGGDYYFPELPFKKISKVPGDCNLRSPGRLSLLCGSYIQV
jgi:hypothetical protein